MQSSIGWIDFSSIDRDKVKSVMSLLADPGMVDELGIGSIRDSFSDTLFPGISTIQTRAKYFVTIPRIIRDFEQMPDSQRNRVGGLSRYLSEQEDECARLFAKPFSDFPDSGEKGSGIIGISALKSGVMRKPSEIYWGGLRTFGLVRTRLSRAEFCRLLDQRAASLPAASAGLATEAGEDRDATTARSHVRLPCVDSEWKTDLSIELTGEEAQFLLHQMNQPALTGSLLCELLQNEGLRQLFLSEGLGFSKLPELLRGQVPEPVARHVQMASDFWTLLEGAHIRYNCLLQKHFGTGGLRDSFEDQWRQWLEEISEFPWSRWDIQPLWSLAEDSGHHVREHTREFVEQWCAEVRRKPAWENATTRLDELVTWQEMRNKRKKSRLSQSAISVREWIGIKSVDYRFRQVQRIMRDLQEGLQRHA